jgi:hypothetical protein
MGGVLQIQAVFPDGTAAVIHSFGDYADQPYVVSARAERDGVYRLYARPFQHEGTPLSTKTLKVSGLLKTMKALHLAEPQISNIAKGLESRNEVEIGGRTTGAQRIFKYPDLVAAGFDATTTE